MRDPILQDIIECISPIINMIVIPVLVAALTMSSRKNYELRDRNKDTRLKLEHARDIKTNAQGAVLMYMARKELLVKLDTALTRGYTTQEEYDELSELYDAYVTLGGNSTVHHMWEDKYSRLKIVKEKEVE
jgi:hypothetical protein